jgi:prophage regulatory protein
MNMAITILRLPAVKERTALSRSSIYLRISKNEFPASISLGGRAVGWLEEDIDKWLEQKIEVSRQS